MNLITNPVNKYYLTWSLFLTLSGIPDIVLKIPYIFPKNETPNRMGGSYLPGSYQAIQDVIPSPAIPDVIPSLALVLG